MTRWLTGLCGGQAANPARDPVRPQRRRRARPRRVRHPAAGDPQGLRPRQHDDARCRGARLAALSLQVPIAQLADRGNRGCRWLSGRPRWAAFSDDRAGLHRRQPGTFARSGARSGTPPSTRPTTRCWPTTTRPSPSRVFSIHRSANVVGVRFIGPLSAGRARLCVRMANSVLRVHGADPSSSCFGVDSRPQRWTLGAAAHRRERRRGQHRRGPTPRSPRPTGPCEVPRLRRIWWRCRSWPSPATDSSPSRRCSTSGSSISTSGRVGGVR